MNWIRHNPITVIAAAGAVAALVLLVLLIQQRPQATRDMEQTPRDFISRVQSIQTTQVTLPGDKPEDPPREQTLIPTEDLIEVLEEVYGQGGLEALGMEATLVAINRTANRGLVMEQRQEVLGNDDYLSRYLDGDENLTDDMVSDLMAAARNAGAGRHERLHGDLFPDTGNRTPEVVFGEAHEDVRRAIGGMLQSGRARMPGLRAGPRFTEEQREELLEEVRRSFLRQKGIRADNGVDLDEALTREERQELRQRQSTELRNAITERAKRIGIYAQTSTSPSETFPFALPEWFRERAPESLAEAWWLQHDLWIYQDLVTAIAVANRLDQADSSLVDQPVKRLIRMRVRPGYVGAGGARGALVGEDAASRRSSQAASWDARRAATPRAAGSSGTRLAATWDDGEDAFRLPVDFALTPTGRVTAGPLPAEDGALGNGDGERVINPLYLVRHAEMSVVVDQEHIPALLEAINQVNLMTVLNVNVRAVDPYEALANGFWYGEGDLMQLDLVIESLWLRQWLAPGPDPDEHGGLMPKSVRQEIGIADDPDREDDRDDQYQPRREPRPSGRDETPWDEF